jgi:hypothetical protein
VKRVRTVCRCKACRTKYVPSELERREGDRIAFENQVVAQAAIDHRGIHP